MRSFLTVLMLQVVICSTVLAADYPIAGIESLFYVEEGWTWGAFSDDESSLNASDAGIVLDIQPAAAGDWPETTNGGLGINFGNMAYDWESHQVEVVFRVLPNNESDSFRVVLNEPDTPNTGEEFQYYFNGLLDYEENQWVTVTQRLDSPTAIYPDNHDGVPANGLDSVQLGLWEMPGALNIELGGIYVKPIDPTPSNVLFEFNSNNAMRAWRWGAFDDENSTVRLTDTSIMLDIQPAAGGDHPGLVNGGMGSAWLRTEFEDPEDYEIVVTAKLGENNEASLFNVTLFDNDELNEIINWDDPRQLDQSAEEFQFQFSTDDLSEEEFIELRQPLTDPGPSYRQKMGKALDDGDGEMNFGMYGVQIQSLWDSVERLNLEIESIRIKSVGETVLGDYDGSGVLDAPDLDLQAIVIANETNEPYYDLNDDQVVDFADREIWVNDLKTTWIGDANLDLEFNSSDMVQVFAQGKYEKPETAGWEDGDWNGDTFFNSSDMVAAFAAGGYEKGPRADAVAVPEPGSWLLCLLAGLVILNGRRPR